MTPLHHKCLTFIEDFIEQNGFSPSLSEIALGIGLKSKSSAHRVVACLKDRRKIAWLPHQSRSIEVIPESGPVACKLCEDSLMEGDWKSLNGAQICIADQPCSYCHGGADTVTQRKAKAA